MRTVYYICNKILSCKEKKKKINLLKTGFEKMAKHALIFN